MVLNSNAHKCQDSVLSERSMASMINELKVSEGLFAEQIVSEIDKSIQGEKMSELTFMQYVNMDNEAKNRINNRVRQWALKARNNLPKDHGMFCLVVSHLLKNAHRYFQIENPSQFQWHLMEPISESAKSELFQEFKEANRDIREIGSLKSKNRLKEHEELVGKMKRSYHSLWNISCISGISVKTVQKWCSCLKEKIHKGSNLSKLRKEEFQQFLLQDSIS